MFVFPKHKHVISLFTFNVWVVDSFPMSASLVCIFGENMFILPPVIAYAKHFKFFSTKIEIKF